MKKNLLFEKADRIAKLIYKLSLNFPQIYQFSLGEQIRRSSLSIILNIVEGGARISNKEKKTISQYKFFFIKRDQIFNLLLFWFRFDFEREIWRSNY